MTSTRIGDSRPIPPMTTQPGTLRRPVHVARSTWPRLLAAGSMGSLAVTAIVAVLTVGWALVNLANGWTGFAVLVPSGFRGGGEAAISLARLFAALVLLLIASDRAGWRLRWIAAGFLVLGFGQLIFGYLEPTFISASTVNDAIYQMVFVRTLAAVLFIVGLLPRTVPRASIRMVTWIASLSALAVAAWAIARWLDEVPPLVRTESMAEAARYRIAPLSWLTTWHWLFAIPPFALAVVAAVASFSRRVRDELPAWLSLAIVLLAASELHDSLWPSAYGASMVMNTADILRLAMAAVVAVGGALELRRIAAERAVLLAAEHDRAQRLVELNAQKADFTAMVAHELGYPLSAIRRQTELLALNGLEPEMRRQAVDAILQEADALDARIGDVQSMAEVERDDFRARLRPVTIGSLMQGARRIAAAHSAEHRLAVEIVGLAPSDPVQADPDRIGQVLRNLLCNAAKYAPNPSQILLTATAAGANRVHIAVSDRGPGIHPDDRDRIFRKFGRSRRQQLPGAGLGLYLSRRIVQAHGSDLTVRPREGGGSVFAFQLTRATRLTP